jgi:hypothetical protein
MSRDQLADWLHCLEGGMYDWVIDEIRKELAKPNQFYPDWDMIKPFHERIAELEAQLAQPEQEPVAWRNAAIRLGEDLYSVGPNGYYEMTAKQWLDWALSVVNTAPPRKEWVGLTNEEIDWILDLAYANDMELIKTIEAKLKEKNT